MNPIRNDFISEAEDILHESQEYLLELQETCDKGFNPETINALFRSIHTLKGISGIFGMESLKELSHALEGLLDDIRLGEVEVTKDVVSFLFRNIDILRDLIQRADEEHETDISEFIKEIETFKGKTKVAKLDISLEGLFEEEILKVLSEYEEHRLKANIKEGSGIYMMTAVLSLSDFDEVLQELTNKIKKEGELISTLPISEKVSEGSIGFKLLIASSKDSEFMKRLGGFECEEVIERKGEKVEIRKAKPSLMSASTTVRVDIKKLDRILSTIGEVSLTKEALKRIEGEIIDTYGRTSLVFDIDRVFQIFERKLTELQQLVLEIRMVPIGQIFSRLAQIVRRYSREIGKPVDLKVFGEETEIDKFLAEEIVDPLMHIVRNALDHGIEDLEARRKLGKSEKALIQLRAFQRGNHVVVELEDDGRGIDIERIRKKALEGGIISEEKELDESELINLIFASGFSTKESVTEVSGRGIGMDVVRNKISSIGGFINIRSDKDRFTCLSLTLPITLAIVKSLLIKVGSHDFALPLTSISETLFINLEDLQSIEGRLVLNLRGDPLPVTSVAELFGIESSSRETAYVVVAGFGERKIGLLVDELVGGQDMVIRSLGEYFERLKGFAGAAEVGRHQLVLIIDVESIVEETLIRHKGLLHV
jgi:two-component system chemotaxis sensor kinase CheA